MEDQEQNESNNNSQKKNVRKPTTLKALLRNRASNQKFPIQFNNRLRPKGPNKNAFISFVALEGRQRASILIPQWEDVEEGVKNQIWEAIRVVIFFIITLIYTD
ncbi:unnamed protein product [Cuscuta epithymum]|uniref:Uncharacterized protein n=1 Tax=Cuscuta epithymum TaxID=186058 RepID=A0AAV0CDJ8_9ASTE|nr:unnamed protein product [Cuscuta epithymum]